MEFQYRSSHRHRHSWFRHRSCFRVEGFPCRHRYVTLIFHASTVLTLSLLSACYPLVISAGYIRLRVVVLKDQSSKKEHAASAQLACEAAGAIRTVASLGREEDCCRQYSESLEIPLNRSKRSGVLSNFIYALSQSMGFFVIALVFWYGALLVSRLELSMFNFFVSLMVSKSILTHN